jgi:hypothetical protein
MASVTASPRIPTIAARLQQGQGAEKARAAGAVAARRSGAGGGAVAATGCLGGCGQRPVANVQDAPLRTR